MHCLSGYERCDPPGFPGIRINHQIWPLHREGWRPEFPVRPEKTTFLLQQDNSRPHNTLKTVGQVTKFCWAVLPHPPYSPDFVPSDFHLFGPMKDGLRVHFLDKDSSISAARKWVASSDADFCACSVHRWRKCISSGATIISCSWQIALSNGVIVHPVHLSSFPWT